MDEFVEIDIKEEKRIAGFTRNEIDQQVRYCGAAYMDYSFNMSFLEAGVALFSFMTSTSSGYIRGQGPHVDIVYKGTDTRRDLVTDAYGLPLNGALVDDGFYHRGFGRAFESSWSQVLRHLESYAASQGLAVGELYYTVAGHSLGAAQATLLAKQLSKLVDPERVRIVTIGSPRVFSRAAAREYDAVLGPRTLRISESDVDPVTMVGPGFLGFKHVGVNLSVVKPAGLYPHLVEGYKAGIDALDAMSFIPTFSAGARRRALYSIKRVCGGSI
jgi:hypothetical protein